jgi:ubiquinone/menaquinone biosynthesis C-methylase UbiE
MANPVMVFDADKLNQFMESAIHDLGAAMHASLVLIGDRLGLYKEMAAAGELTSVELAKRAGVDERYVREWLNANAASGYVKYNAAGTYSLPPEQAMALAVEDSPVFLAGAFQLIYSIFQDVPKIEDAFRTGRGVGWHEHHHDLFRGTERFFRPAYAANLATSWLPALEGVVAKLERGAKVADVGCGLGASTIVMAKAYPNSTFVGFDYHPSSIEMARERAAEAGLGDRVRFEVAPAANYPGSGYDLVTFFDCLHDMGDPVGAAKHVYKTLDPEGTWMIVEPFAHDDVESNLNPIGRMYYSASTMLCTPASKSQEVGLALGAQAGEARIREVVTQGGFARFRRATDTPVNMVFDARR